MKEESTGRSLQGAARQAFRRSLDKLDFDDRRFAETVDFAKPLRPRRDGLGEGAKARDQGLGERLHVAPRDGAKQQQLQHFVIGKRRFACIHEAIAQTLSVTVEVRRRIAQA